MANADQKSPGNMKVEIPLVPALLIMIIVLLAVIIGLVFLPRPLSIGASPSAEPTITKRPSAPPTTQPEPTAPESFGNTPEEAVNGFYSAVRDVKRGILFDEWMTTSLAQRLSEDADYEYDKLQLKEDIEWDIIEISEVDYSEFQVAFVQYENEDVSKCELLELANPTSTGDHWRVSDISEADCESGEKIVSLAPTPTAVKYLNPELDYIACPSSYNSHLALDMVAYVSEDPPIPNNLRETAGLAHQRVGELQPGEEAYILDGPKCIDGWVWWDVRSLVNGERGWTSEAGSEWEYWLIPLGWRLY